MLKPMCQTSTWVNIAGDQLPAGAVGDARAQVHRRCGARALDVAATGRRTGCRRAARADSTAGCCAAGGQISSQTATLMPISTMRGQRRRWSAAARRTPSARPRVVLAPSATHVGHWKPDRRVAHAVGADRPLAALAADVGLPVGVPVAGRHPDWGVGVSGTGGWVMRGGSAADDLDGLDDHGLDRAVHRAGRAGRDRVDDVAGGLVGDLAEDRVLEVQPRGRGRR